MIVVTGTTVACASQNLQRAGTGNRAGVVATIGSQHEPFRLEAQPTIGVLVACPKKRMRVRLIKKLAEVIDGIDLTAVKAGDVLNLERSEAQLLIVSHQKRTMEAADCLYGVTMQPGGSSKLVAERMRQSV